MAKRINDLLLAFNYVFGHLTRSDKLVLYTGVRDFSLRGTIQCETWGCYLYALCAVVYGGRCSLTRSIVLHHMG